MLISTALLLDSIIRNSVCTPAKLPCRRVEVGYERNIVFIQGLLELADQNNAVKSLSSGNNRKNILKNPSSLNFKIRTFLIDQSRVDIKLP
jgi:hypothetical protein